MTLIETERRFCEIHPQNPVAIAHTHNMSHPPDTDTTIQQPMEPTIDTDAVMAAAAAADAVANDLHQNAASATSGEAHAW